MELKERLFLENLSIWCIIREDTYTATAVAECSFTGAVLLMTVEMEVVTLHSDKTNALKLHLL